MGDTNYITFITHKIFVLLMNQCCDYWTVISLKNWSLFTVNVTVLIMNLNKLPQRCRSVATALPQRCHSVATAMCKIFSVSCFLLQPQVAQSNLYKWFLTVDNVSGSFSLNKAGKDGQVGMNRFTLLLLLIITTEALAKPPNRAHDLFSITSHTCSMLQPC